MNSSHFRCPSPSGTALPHRWKSSASALPTVISSCVWLTENHCTFWLSHMGVYPNDSNLTIDTAWREMTPVAPIAMHCQESLMAPPCPLWSADGPILHKSCADNHVCSDIMHTTVYHAQETPFSEPFLILWLWPFVWPLLWCFLTLGGVYMSVSFKTEHSTMI